MNPTLAAMYNTHGYGEAAASQQQELALLDLFAKTAAAVEIDLSQLTPEVRQELYSNFVNKLASEEGAEHDIAKAEKHEEKAKKEESEAEHEEEKAKEELHKKAAAEFEGQQKMAEADFLGRQMAHAYWDELQGIQKEAAEPSFVTHAREGAEAHHAKMPVHTVAEPPKGIKRRLSVAASHAGEAAGRIGKHIAGNKGRYAAGAAGTAAIGAGAAVAHHLLKGKHEEKKEASAFDVVAAEYALKLAEVEGWDTDEAITLLNVKLATGVPESTKVAAAGNDYSAAVNVRAHELLEDVGYPIDWTQLFGS